jgi:hypothetical protein
MNIKVCYSNWANQVVIPIVIVPKKNGKLWICVDYIWLHSPTKKDLFPLSFIDEALNILFLGLFFLHTLPCLDPFIKRLSTIFGWWMNILDYSISTRLGKTICINLEWGINSDWSTTNCVQKPIRYKI